MERPGYTIFTFKALDRPLSLSEFQLSYKTIKTGPTLTAFAWPWHLSINIDTAGKDSHELSSPGT